MRWHCHSRCGRMSLGRNLRVFHDAAEIMVLDPRPRISQQILAYAVRDHSTQGLSAEGSFADLDLAHGAWRAYDGSPRRTGSWGPR